MEQNDAPATATNDRAQNSDQPSTDSATQQAAPAQPSDAQSSAPSAPSESSAPADAPSSSTDAQSSDESAKSAEPTPAPVVVLSAADIITRDESRLFNIARLVLEAQSSIAALADDAARNGVSADALARIAAAEASITNLTAERISLETTLVPLRAAVAKVQAEQEAAAEEAQLEALEAGMGTLVDQCAADAVAYAAAVRALVTAAQNRRSRRKQLRDALTQVVTDPQKRGTINSLASPLFDETPNLESFLSVDATIVVTDEYVADRAQRLKDRITEATA